MQSMFLLLMANSCYHYCDDDGRDYDEDKGCRLLLSGCSPSLPHS